MRLQLAKHDLSPRPAVLAMIALVAAVTVAECAFRALYDGLWRYSKTPGYFLIYAPPILTAVVSSLVFAYVFRHKGFPALILASLTLSVFTVSFFRGSHRWPGFYDLGHESRWPFIVGWLCGVLIGFALSGAFSLPRLTSVLQLMILLALVWVWVDALRGLAIVTEIPYTRHFALSALALAAVLILIADRMELLGGLQS
jgi:hypothetical protein